MNDEPASQTQPGIIVLFGSGETSPSGRLVWEWLLRQIDGAVNVAVLETPAGFQPNSPLVAQEIADFLRQRLQNYHPQVSIIPARKRGTLHSPDDPKVLEPALHANAIFLGPGSPTYAARQLRDSVAWHTVVAQHRLGAHLVLASAAVIAAGTHALPVYEIYKAGEELHWQPGLDLFGPYGLRLVFVSHWDNREGGAGLNTTRCYMGPERFKLLRGMLPAGTPIAGIDEHTALVFNIAAGECEVKGKGTVTILRDTQEQVFNHGDRFRLDTLGAFHVPPSAEGIPPDVWERAVRASADVAPVPKPPPEALALMQSREAARTRQDWAAADAARHQLHELGWQVLDTPGGPQLAPRDRATPDTCVVPQTPD